MISFAMIQKNTDVHLVYSIGPFTLQLSQYLTYSLNFRWTGQEGARVTMLLICCCIFSNGVLLFFLAENIFRRVIGDERQGRLYASNGG